MALSYSSFGAIFQNSSENMFAANASNNDTNTQVETAGSIACGSNFIAWGGFDVCRFSAASSSAPPSAETAGSIASGFAAFGCAAGAGTVTASGAGTAGVSSAGTSTSSSSCCSYTC